MFDNNIDPLSKIMSVKIEKKSRLSPEDQAYIDDVGEKKDKILNFFHNEIKRAESELVTASFFNKKEYLDGLNERRAGMLFDMVNKVVYYFAGKYNVTLAAEPIAKKYINVSDHHRSHYPTEYRKQDYHKAYGDNIKMKTLLDEIFIQLKGMTFQEKQEYEIVTLCKKCFTSYRNEPVVTISKDKLCCTHLPAPYEYSRNDNVITLFQALSHFETEGCGTILESFKPFDGYRNRDFDVYTKHEFPALEKVKSIKYFKNGKGEIWFKDNATACEFARKYMGY